MIKKGMLNHEYSIFIVTGLGVYGRQSLIITPEYGPRVNFGVVLTDASINLLRCYYG